MITPYTFASDDEPSEEQLAELMHEVALEARERAMKAERNFRDELRQSKPRSNSYGMKAMPELKVNDWADEILKSIKRMT